MQGIEHLGSFYLGRQHDLSSGETLPRQVQYDSKDLTTHAVCVGMTGSGKTGLCLSLLEEAGLDGVPAIAIDPKGDLGNLLLTFPELRPGDFRPWIDESVASRKGLTPDAYAEQTAALWKNGLADWGQSGERIRAYNNKVDRAIYTPGSSAGLPLTILKSFNAPPQAVLDDSDAMRDRVQSAASGVLALLGIDADPVKSREHILLSNVLDRAWREGRDLDLPALIHEIQQPPFMRVGVVDLESFFPASDRLELGMRLNNLLASPSFASWMEGEPLDVQRLLYTADAKPRLSILSIAHLNESERMFFVTILLNEILAWVRSQPGTSSLRAILYMDEVYGYFPPVGNPPAKRPMLTLLKQARAYGLGCVLATQNPVDLDYKGLSNAGTWFLGRLQTERDKARVIEGLEGASAQAGAKFNRSKMEATLAALGSRVFLMNNVHESAPTVFHTRWAMSYLSGPLTRSQISQLMADRKAQQAAEATDADQSSGGRSAAQATPPSASASAHASRPMLSAEIAQRFWPVVEPPPEGATLVYRPALSARARLHFVKASDDVDIWRECTALQSACDGLPQPVWETAMVFDRATTLREEPQDGATFEELVGELAQEKNYRSWQRELKDRLYRTERLALWECEQLDARSREGESETDFRLRLTQRVREQRDDKKEQIKRGYAPRLERQTTRVEKAEQAVSEEKSQFWSKIGQIIWRIFEVLLIRLTGGRTRKQIVTSTSASQAMRERRQSSRAANKLADELERLDQIKTRMQDEIDQLEFDLQPDRLKLEKVEFSPRKSDIGVDEVALAWLPWWRRGDGSTLPAY